MPPKLTIEETVLNSTNCKVAPEFSNALARARAPSLTLEASVLLIDPDSSKTKTTLRFWQSNVCGMFGFSELVGAVLAAIKLDTDFPAFIKSGLGTSGLSHSEESGASV